MRENILTACLVLWASVLPMLGQVPSGEEDKVVLSDTAMREVVSRILRWQFKSGRAPRLIPVAGEGIKGEWLPRIENVTFKLVSDNDALKYKKGAFLFDAVERVGRSYTINVGWGDFECSASGDTWKFTLVAEKVRLWRTGEQWGRGCGGNGPPIIRGLKVGALSPNELPGYEFFKKGKLKAIRLGLSTRDDMKKLFGDTCEGDCDYDEHWTVWVNYFEETGTRTETKTDSDGVETKIELFPRPEFVGTLRFVRLSPKNRISFLRILFPGAFARNQLYSIGDNWGEEGFEGAVHTSNDTYTDGYGLQYEIYNEETFNNVRVEVPSAVKVSRKGDLVGIEYQIPDVLTDEIYVRRPRTGNR